MSNSCHRCTTGSRAYAAQFYHVQKCKRAIQVGLKRPALLQEPSWKAERERLCRDKAALQRECRQLLERLQELQGLVSAPTSQPASHCR